MSMTTPSLVEPALRATYHLAGSDAQRLRRLTRQSGIDAENVLSRLAIVQSITTGRSGPHANYEPSTAGKTKEIKGSVLLGRPRQAALLLALLAHCHHDAFLDAKTELTWHWARGLKLLEEASTNGDVLYAFAEQLASHKGPSTNSERRTRRSGLGDSLRDELAAAVGRRFPRWSTEVCRLVAMAARLDPNELDTVTERLATEVREHYGDGLITETVALRIVQQHWGLNRLGLTQSDRDALSRLLVGDLVEGDHPSLPFLAALGLVTTGRGKPRLTAIGRRLGEEAIHP